MNNCKILKTATILYFAFESALTLDFPNNSNGLLEQILLPTNPMFDFARSATWVFCQNETY